MPTYSEEEEETGDFPEHSFGDEGASAGGAHTEILVSGGGISSSETSTIFVPSTTYGAFELSFCTSNQDKVTELRQLLEASKVNNVIVTLVNLDLPELQGIPPDITRAKCRHAYELLNKPVLVEDVSLCFNALGGLPGPYIRHFLSRLKCEGLYKLLQGWEDKSAYAQCLYGFWDGTTPEPLLFDGRTDGTIVEPRGPQSFGWDPIFEAKDTGSTYAEMSKEVKNGLSHRGRAFAKLVEFLRTKTATRDASSAEVRKAIRVF